MYTQDFLWGERERVPRLKFIEIFMTLKNITIRHGKLTWIFREGSRKGLDGHAEIWNWTSGATWISVRDFTLFIISGFRRVEKTYDGNKFELKKAVGMCCILCSDWSEQVRSYYTAESQKRRQFPNIWKEKLKWVFI